MSSKKIKIHVWHTGAVLVDTAIPFRNTSAIPLGLGRSRRHKVILPVSSYFIEHPQGKILIDTGWPESVRTSPYTDLGLTSIASKPALPFNWSVREHLTAINMTPNQIDYVLLSHLDTDYVGGLQLIQDAKKIITSSEELKATQKFNIRYRHNLWKYTEIEPFKYVKSGIGPLGKSYDLFKDGTVIILLASDVGYDERNLSENILPGLLSNKTAEMSSLMWVKQMSQNVNCQEIIFNHDRQINEKQIIL